MRRRNLDRQRRRLVARISCDGDGLRGFVRQGRRGSFSSLETFFVGCRGVRQLGGLVLSCKSFLITVGSLKVENKRNVSE